MKRKQAASNNPCSVACMSLNLTPSTYKTDWLYARMRAFNAKILNICNVVTKVHRPCFITWQTGKKRQHRKCQHYKGHNKRREEKSTRCHWKVYCTYNMLNMFRALLCPSSGAQDYMCYYRQRCAVLGCWLSEVRCRATGYAFRVRDVAPLALSWWQGQWSNIPHPGRIAGGPAPYLRQPATKASHTIGGNNTHTVLSSWWWAQKCLKHVEHIISAINHSVASSWFFFSMHMQRCTDKHTSRAQ